MRKLVLVIRRELAERKMLMVGSLAIGVTILLVPFISTASRHEVWTIASLYGSVFLGLGIAGFAASSVVATDLRERRITFFMGRPIPSLALWSGKMIAAWLLGLICAIGVLLPVTIAGSGVLFLFGEVDASAPVLGFALFIGIVLIPLANAIGISLRARSPWLLLDLVSLTFLGSIAWAALRPFTVYYAWDLIGVTMMITILLLMLALLAGGYIGFAAGRFDLRKVHKRQSIITSGSMILLGVAVSLFAFWARSVDIHEVTNVYIVPCRSGDCQPMFRGSSKLRGDFAPVFAMSGDSIRRIDSAYEVRVARESGRIVWESIDSIDPPTAHIRYIDRGMAAPVATSITTDPHHSAIAVSPAGDHLALAQPGTIQIIDLVEQRVIRTIRMEETFRHPLRFAGPTTVLAVLPPGGGLKPRWRVVTVDTSSGETRTIQLESYPRFFDPVNRIILTSSGGELIAYSSETWEPVVRVSGDSAVSTQYGVLVARPRRNEVALVGLDDGSVRTYRLPEGVTDVAFGPVHDGSVTMALVSKSKIDHLADRVPDNTRLVSLDLETGEIVELERDLLPVRAFDPEVTGPYFLRNRPEGRELVRVEPDTREITVLTGKAS